MADLHIINAIKANDVFELNRLLSQPVSLSLYVVLLWLSLWVGVVYSLGIQSVTALQALQLYAALGRLQPRS